MSPNQSEDQCLVKYFKYFDLNNTGIKYFNLYNKGFVTYKNLSKQ